MRPHGWQERGRNGAYSGVKERPLGPAALSKFDSKMPQIGGVRGMQAAY